MKLDSIQIKNFRSLWAEQDEPEMHLELSEHANFIVGPNNCGKSNVLRALALALQDHDGSRFDRQIDVPARMNWAVSSITLQFRFNPSASSPEATLRERARKYELSIKQSKKKTFAEQGILRYTVQYRGSKENSTRVEGLQAAGAGAIRGDLELLNAAIEQFHKVVRFLYIKSGEDLSSALAGGLTEVLTNVLQEHLKEQMKEAKAKREEYLRHLSTHLLQPLSAHLGEELSSRAKVNG